MKKILIFLLSFFTAYAGISQAYVKPNTSYGIIQNRSRPDSTLWFPTGCGVPSGIASVRSTNQRMGAVFYDSCGKKAYVFHPTDSTWTEMGGGSYIAGNSIAIEGGVILVKGNDSLNVYDRFSDYYWKQIVMPDSSRVSIGGYDDATGRQAFLNVSMQQGFDPYIGLSAGTGFDGSGGSLAVNSTGVELVSAGRSSIALNHDIVAYSDSIKLLMQNTAGGYNVAPVVSTRIKHLYVDTLTGMVVTLPLPTSPYNPDSVILNQLAYQTGKTASIRSLRLDTLYSRTSTALIVVNSAGVEVMRIGNGGGTTVSIEGLLTLNGGTNVNGAADYGYNRASLYTARSFTDKNYVDSAMTASGLNKWGILGNSGLSSSSNFIGTTDSIDFNVRVKNIQFMSASAFSATGQFLHFQDPVTTATNPAFHLNINGSRFRIQDRGTTWFDYSGGSGTTLIVSPGIVAFTGLVAAPTLWRTTPTTSRRLWSLNGVAGTGSTPLGNAWYSFGNEAAWTINTGIIDSSYYPFHNYYDSTIMPFSAGVAREITRLYTMKLRPTYGGTDSVYGVVYDPIFTSTPAKNYSFLSSSGQVGFGTLTPDASAAVEVQSTTQGFLMPRMNTTQMLAIPSPATGLQVYNPDSAAVCWYNGAAWVKTAAGGSGIVDWATTGNTLTGSEIFGSLNDYDLTFKRNNLIVGRWLDSSFHVGVGAGIGQSGTVQSIINLGIDAGALADSSSDANNFGYQAGYNTNASGQANNLGYQSGYGAIYGDNANNFGTFAGHSTSGSGATNNFGAISGFGAINSPNSNNIGFTAGRDAVASPYSNNFGSQAGHLSDSSEYANRIGYNAAYDADKTSYSNAIGYLALWSATGAHHTNAIGPNAGTGNTYGSYNNLFGYNAGFSFVGNNIGRGNIVAGVNVSLPNGAANSMNLGGAIYATGLHFDSTISNPSITPEAGAQVGIGIVTPHASALLDLTSTDKGLLLPRNTTAGIAAISSPAKGLMVYDSTQNSPAYYNGTAWATVQNTIYSIEKYTALGSGLKGVTAPIELMSTAGGILGDAGLNVASFYTPKAIAITKAWWYQSTQGSYTSDNYNGIGVYSYSGGTATLVASTSNDGDIWKATANTWNSKDLATPVTLQPGFYYIAALYNSSAQSTAPAVAAPASVVNGNIFTNTLFTNSAKLRFVLAGQSTMPSTITLSATSATTTNPWFGVE